MLFVCAGDCGVDRFVERGLVRAGGCALNVAAHLSDGLPDGHRVEVVAAIGDDGDAAVVRDALAERGLGRYVRIITGGRTPSQRIALLDDGERRFCGYDEGVLRRFRVDAAQAEAIAQADVVHAVLFSQVTGFFESVLTSPRRGALCVDFSDLGDFGGSLTPVQGWLDAARVGFFGLSRHDGTLIDALGERARHSGALYVVTLGAAGSVCFDGAARYEAPAERVAQVVDTTGAGDTYAGVFMSRYFTGAPVPQAMRAAAREAAATVARIGGFATAAARVEPPRPR